MKTFSVLFSVTIALLFSACTSSLTNHDALLKDEAQRKAIISKLMQNHDYAIQVMDSIIERDHTEQMMSLDKGLMHMMMTDKDITKIMVDTAAHRMMMNNMMRMIEKDSADWIAMCQKMMENPKMKQTMQDVLEKK